MSESTPPNRAEQTTATRLLECVERWPECESGAYDPRCCRFPKSCSCTSGAGEREKPPAAAMESLQNAIGQAIRMVEDARLEIAMHPDDVTDEVRQKVAVVPLTTLRETRLIAPGTAYLIRPGALHVLYGDKEIESNG